MDLTDILFSKPFIGSDGGGGGGSNVETATIEITVTDGTPTITSGAFPDWCIGANSDYIYGGIATQDVSCGADDANPFVLDDSLRRLHEVVQYDGVNVIGANGYPADERVIYVATDLSLVIEGENGAITNGTLTVTLIYMPEE